MTRLSRRRHLALLDALALTGLAAVAAPPARAQDYPSQTIHLIVPFPPGSNTDFYARELAAGLQERLGQTVIVENKPGAASLIGSTFVAQAAPDGYTLLVNSNSLVTTNVTAKTPPFDPQKDLVPVTLAAEQPIALAVTPDVPGATFAEVLADLKKNPGKYVYTTSGIGSPQHLSFALFSALTGVDAVHLPMQGQGQMITEMLAGRAQIGFLVFSSAKAHFDSGALRALGAGKDRIPVAPDLPTLAEQGITDFSVTFWLGVLAPAGTPEAVVARLNEAIVAVGNDPAVKQKLADAGIYTIGSTPEAFGTLIAGETSLWSGIMEKAGIEKQ